MAAPRIQLGKAQLDDLNAVCTLGEKLLRQIEAAICQPPISFKRDRLQEQINEVAGPEKGALVGRFLFGVSANLRRDATTATDVFDRITETLASAQRDNPAFEHWPACRPIVERMVARGPIVLAAKALDVAYDFERLFLSARILTGVRPIFNEEKDAIIASTITQTLRIGFASSSGNDETITLELDQKDLEQLREACDDALKKSRITKESIEKKWGVEALTPGEDL